MIAYFDTSTIVPLLIDEPASASCREFWESTEKRASTRLLYIEAVAALERAFRMGRVSRAESVERVYQLQSLWRGFAVHELDEQLMLDASAMSRQFGLRGYDSVHCAAAFQMNGEDVIAASSDKHLNEAWSDLGLATFDPKP